MSQPPILTNKLLAALAEGPGTVSELSAEFSTRSQIVSEALRKLEKNGRVVRSAERVRFPCGPKFIYRLPEHAAA